MAVIVGGARTPIGKLLGSLSQFPATDLGGFAIKAALERSGVAPGAVEYVIMGQVLTAGCGQIPARQAAVKAGIPMSVPALTVNKVCLSGIDAIALAGQLIRAGEFDVVVAGGMESMSQAPHLLPGSRTGHKYGDASLIDHLAYDGLHDAFTDQAMGALTEGCNTSGLRLSREEQDAFAARSHQRAAQAWKDGRFDEEVVPVEIPQRKGEPVVFNTDEGIRADTTVESLGRLRPAFRPDGTITAGSASQISDGAAAVLLMTREKADALGLRPRARLVDQTTVGVDPVIMLTGPIPATQRILERNGMKIDDIDLIEINEAFAAQVLADGNELGFDWDRVNVNGGAIALGHPLGSTGARLLTTLLHELERQDALEQQLRRNGNMGRHLDTPQVPGGRNDPQPLILSSAKRFSDASSSRSGSPAAGR
jgi:acetyl-CoA C-acetyltransferase